MSDIQDDNIPKFEYIINNIEREYNITYNHDQIRAIREAMINQITIVTGGPGTGKTTIIKGILKMYQELFDIGDKYINKHVALLAPTGRAAKRMSESTFMPAYTIHRYLKWNKETNEFGVNELNPNEEDLIIVDETSMIDIDLFASLLKGIRHSSKIVLVGDSNQLPSVGPGNILKDIIDSDMFAHIELSEIYRQSEDSFIPILADEIKKHEITSDILIKRDDYNFIEAPSEAIANTLYEIVNRGLIKGLDEKNVQVLIPMYKGINGIDTFNETLEFIFNPGEYDTHKVGNVTYKVGDKVINLVNNVDLNIFNGDIGYITWIDPKNKEGIMGVNFYGHEVALKNEDILALKHAYAMSIHKAQGSEFDHVILPITKEYSRMLYNKLIYTAVSRAKKSLIIIGDINAFMYAVKNTYTSVRKTTLKEMILEQFKRIQ
jgi:exodeoxyribonuclease V alpha subunit